LVYASMSNEMAEKSNVGVVIESSIL
jgi:hypothetical protein